MNYEENVKLAANEIDAIYKKYDIAGIAIIVAPDDIVAEVLNISPSFSFARQEFGPNNERRIVIDNGDGSKQMYADFIMGLKNTGEMFFTLSRRCGRNQLIFTGAFQHMSTSLSEVAKEMREGRTSFNFKGTI